MAVLWYNSFDRRTRILDCAFCHRTANRLQCRGESCAEAGGTKIQRCGENLCAARLYKRGNHCRPGRCRKSSRRCKSGRRGKQQKEGYVLQFGAFSTKAAAQELSDALQAKGIKTRVVEIDSVFKVLSPVTEQKESALQALQEAKEKNVSEVFIAAMEG